MTGEVGVSIINCKDKQRDRDGVTSLALKCSAENKQQRLREEGRERESETEREREGVSLGQNTLKTEVVAVVSYRKYAYALPFKG